jgi:hypothetical protein
MLLLLQLLLVENNVDGFETTSSMKSGEPSVVRRRVPLMVDDDTDGKDRMVSSPSSSSTEFLPDQCGWNVCCYIDEGNYGTTGGGGLGSNFEFFFLLIDFFLTLLSCCLPLLLRSRLHQSSRRQTTEERAGRGRVTQTIKNNLLQ